jgi:hypothetical protein
MFVTLPSPIPELQHAPLPLKVLRVREHVPTLCSSDVFSLDSHLNPLKSLGGHQFYSFCSTCCFNPLTWPIVPLITCDLVFNSFYSMCCLIPFLNLLFSSSCSTYYSIPIVQPLVRPITSFLLLNLLFRYLSATPMILLLLIPFDRPIVLVPLVLD